MAGRPPPDIELRAGLSGDYDALDTIKRAASALVGAKYVRPLNREDFDRCIARGGEVTVALHGAAPCGYTMAYRKEEDLYLRNIFVTPALGRRGIGAHLLAEVLRAAQGLNYRAITLVTGERAPWNAPFYAKHGFAALRGPMPEYLQKSLDQERRNFGEGDFSPEFPHLLPRIAMEKLL